MLIVVNICFGYRFCADTDFDVTVMLRICDCVFYKAEYGLLNTAFITHQEHNFFLKFFRKQKPSVLESLS